MLWPINITLGGVDVSATVVGQVQVEAEEFASRVATFSIIPASGAIDVNDWTGKAVTINYVTVNSAGAILTDTRIFTGKVDLPIYNPQNGFVTFACTDSLQERFEGMTDAAILAELTGYYSTSVFGESEDGWQFAQDVLSTVPKGFDLNADGVTGALTAWEAKATADYSYTEANVISGSVSTDLAKRRNLHNKSTDTFDYRFSRSCHREHSYSWAPPSWDFCTYYADSHTLPNRDLINSSASGAGWGLQGGISFGQLPASTAPICGSGVWVISEDLRGQLAVSAGWTSVKRWAQTVTETYTLTVQAPQSVTHFGEIAITTKGALSTDYSDSSWENSTDLSTPSGSTQNANNDWIIERADRVASVAAMTTKLNLMATDILKGHRENYVFWNIELNPNIERSHTLSINAHLPDGRGIEAKGKAHRVIHSVELSTGRSVTLLAIAVSKTGTATPPTADALTPPAAPATVPAISTPAGSTALGTQIGGHTGNPAHDANEDGYSGNYSVITGGNTYPVQFKVDTAAIEDAARNEITGATSQTYEIIIPDETLVITA